MHAYVFAFITIFFWGIAPILEKLGLVKLDPTVAIAIRSFAISICLFVYLLGSGRLPELLTVDARSLLYVAGAGICAGLLGHAAFYYALKYGEASRIVPLTGSFPLLTVILAVLLLGESLTWTKFAGATLVVTGIVLLSYKKEAAIMEGLYFP